MKNATELRRHPDSQSAELKCFKPCGALLFRVLVAW